MKTIIKAIIKASVPFLLSIILVNIFTVQAAAKEKITKINFKETNHDFGKVTEGVELIYVYKFKNEGEKDLVIQKVEPGCGCTGAAIGDKKVYKKGEEGEIKVTLNTSGRSGIQSKTVSVQSNDIENPEVVLSFTCEIISQ